MTRPMHGLGELQDAHEQIRAAIDCAEQPQVEVQDVLSHLKMAEQCLVTGTATVQPLLTLLLELAGTLRTLDAMPHDEARGLKMLAYSRLLGQVRALPVGIVPADPFREAVATILSHLNGGCTIAPYQLAPERAQEAAQQVGALIGLRTQAEAKRAELLSLAVITFHRILKADDQGECCEIANWFLTTRAPALEAVGQPTYNRAVLAQAGGDGQ
ncbi:hypothetical protein [Deinococcus soli (ex Cha et al. 2016)]|uniref:hypothetical protein n=1 Tax=Deinococcus soli (ex Cha et al. 2016) TaxID=1309411 RepID=UPI001663088C|nr:hypothetical protein [Deinococcus soli (ex Cha et al. 2016)]GGB68867.1 hypothetical protein GCM10008019_26370 [Deinococcus soli (ex Cha et al. 2016)]